MGFEFDGEVYVHAGLPFGLSQAPEAFTRVVEVIYRPLRKTMLPLRGHDRRRTGSGVHKRGGGTPNADPRPTAVGTGLVAVSKQVRAMAAEDCEVPGIYH